MSGPGEFELIERYFNRPVREPGVEIGIGDDAAVLAVSGRIVVAVDTLVAGVHFPDDLPARAIGHRALAVNISDVAAMGIAPRWATLALTLPAADELWLDGFAAGLFDLADRYGVSLVGGDTTRGPLTVTVQLIGDAGDDPVLARSGGRPGDGVWVTGTLGDAAGAIAARDRHRMPVPDALEQRLQFPEPRVAIGTGLRSIASAAIDISDGLVADLGHVCEASGCGARIDAGRLPLSAALLEAEGLESARSLALAGGDDYELCVTIPPALEPDAQQAAAAAGVSLTRLGELCDGSGIRLETDGVPYELAAGGYRHF